MAEIVPEERPFGNLAEVNILANIQKYRNNIAGSADSYRQPALAEVVPEERPFGN
jgi:hypothetical protein